MFKKKINPLLIATCVGSATLLSQTAYAAIEEVIVTANKRSESANDVGISISALGGDQIKEQKLTSLEDIASVVPGLVFSPSTTNTPIFTLRGIGFNESSLGVYPSTSLYIDEAPLPFPALAAHAAFDLERAEVLKGPQGTLFGQNSTGGAINFISAKPSHEFGAGGDVSYSRFNKVEVNGFVTGGLTDELAARLAITSVKADDWQKSISRGDENGEEEYTAARLLFDFEPSDTVRINVNLNGWTDKSDPQAQQLAGVRPTIPGAASPELINAQFVPKNARDADWSVASAATPGTIEPFKGSKPSADRQFYQGIVRFDVDLSESVTLTSLTTYSDFEQDVVTDGDGTALVTFDLENIEGSVQSFNTELRLAGEAERFNWIAGVNYDQTETNEVQDLRYFDNSNYNATQPTVDLFYPVLPEYNGQPAPGINFSGVDLDQEIDSWAIFGNMDIELASMVTLKLGARYTETTIDANACSYSTILGGVPQFFNVLGGVSGTAGEIGGLPDCYTLNDQNLPGDAFKDELDEDNVAWRIGLDVDVTDDTLLYFNISQGYKTGSYPALAAAQFKTLAPVTQESNLAYELGMKTLMLDGNLQLNAALFRYNYEDKQVRGKVSDIVFGTLDALVNVPKSEIRGAEFDVTYQPTDNLTLTAQMTYLDSEIKNYEGFNIIGVFEDFSGDRLPFAPELTYSVGLDYRVPLDNGGELFFGANVRGQSDSDAAIGGDRISFPNTPQNSSFQKYPFEMDGYTLLDLRAGYVTEDDKWKIMVWGKNVTDEYYWTSVIPSSDNMARFAGRPATYGITLGYTY
ncbi:MAG: TonB-dependent receptor [Porticoccaceae bacterium]|nr:TonB-dependent receptor [Pseudomonadales bacterium]